MGRKSTKTRRFLSRVFKERQIYHRSDGVVHFISMSARTQIALAVVIGAALLWVAYASVNVVFKEQIIVAKDRDSRILEASYSKRLNQAHRAINDVNSLNILLERQFDESMAEIANRHQTLRAMVEGKVGADRDLSTLASGLSEAGSPNGQKLTNGNRVMIDVAPAEPTPRQSRTLSLRKEAEQEAYLRAMRAPTNSMAAPALERMASSAADLYVEQVLLLALLEERATAQIHELRQIINSTGVSVEQLVPSTKITNTVLAQGGPFIDPSNVASASTAFFRHANRAGVTIDELTRLQSVVNALPLSSPLLTNRKFTSGFGIRRDPINGRAASHLGVDFTAAWASPVTATAAGVVAYAGVRSGFGRVVEVDHGNGFVTRYAHLNRIVVKAGQKVALNQKVGELGNSGRSTGPHVHYEIMFRGQHKNPLRFIEAGRYVFES